MNHDHDHHHHDHDRSELSETELRVRALETILTEKGYVEPGALDAIIQAYETRIGPHNGARVVARAWSDPGEAGAACSSVRRFFGSANDASTTAPLDANNWRLVTCISIRCNYPSHLPWLYPGAKRAKPIPNRLDRTALLITQAANVPCPPAGIL